MDAYHDCGSEEKRRQGAARPANEIGEEPYAAHDSSAQHRCLEAGEHSVTPDSDNGEPEIERTSPAKQPDPEAEHKPGYDSDVETRDSYDMRRPGSEEGLVQVIGDGAARAQEDGLSQSTLRFG